MPGMKLQFIKNAPQRVANSRPLPLKQVEAIILYGKPEQRAKVVEKILPNAYGLALNQTTHYLLMSLIEKCEIVDRVKLLYSIRRKILDLSISPVGNKIIQKLIELLPKRQRVEIAECYVLNVEEDEFKNLCLHSFGNHVAQKLMEFKESADVLEPAMLKYLPILASHEYGMRVVDSYIQNTKSGWMNVVDIVLGVDSEKLITDDGNQEEGEGVLQDEILSTQLDKALYHLFQKNSESMVICSLLRHPLTPVALKDAICAHLSSMAVEYLAPEIMASAKREEETKDLGKERSASCNNADAFRLPDFGNAAGEKPVKFGKDVHGKEEDAARTPRHIHTFRDMFEYGTVEHRRLLWNSFSSPEEEEAGDSNPKKNISTNLIDKLVTDKRVVSVAVMAARFYKPSRSVLLHSLLQVPSSSISQQAEEEKRVDRKKSPKSRTLNEIAKDPVGTHVLRALIEEDSSFMDEKEKNSLLGKAVIRNLSKNPVSSPVLQRLIEADTCGAVAEKVLRAIQSELDDFVFDGSATYVVQCALSRVDATQKAEWSKRVLKSLGNLKNALSFSQGSHVLQKVVQCMDDDGVRTVVKKLIKLAQSGEENAPDEKNESKLDSTSKKRGEKASLHDEESDADEKQKKRTTLTTREQRELNRKKHYSVLSNAILSYATHVHACYVIQALLMETRNRQLDAERRLLMNELKPYVFELAIAPWSGRIVLDAMLLSGSAELKATIKNVVFLKAESWLTEGGGSGKNKKTGSGGGESAIDPTMRHILKRQREMTEETPAEKKASTSTSEESHKPTRKKRNFFQRLKK